MDFDKLFPNVVKEDGEGYELDNETHEDNDDELSGDEELLKALQSLKDEENEDDEDADDDEDSDEDDDSEDDEDDSEDDEEDQEDEDEEEQPKKKQSKEDNAKFAAQRRQQELEKKVQAELERLKNESPEFQLAKSLSDMYGRPAEEIMAEMKEAQLKAEAKQKGLPLELLRERQADRDKMQTLENELNQLKFQNWQTKIKADTESLKSQYTMLTDEDFDGAIDYILNTVRNVDLPLEQAVYAVHGKKIVEGLANAKQQEKLAKESGRKKKTPLAPNNGKPSKVKGLTAEERYVAKQMGLTEEDYLKYK